MAFAPAAAERAASTPGAPLSLVSRLREACWYGRSIRAQLLLTVILIELVAALGAGGVIIIKAKTSTRIEIEASINLAEVLVRDTISLMPRDTPADRFLESLPLRQRFARHVRITVHNAAGQPVRTRPMEGGEETGGRTRPPAPAWFASLISPPIEHREFPIIVGARPLGSVLIAGEPADEIAEVWENLTALGTVAILVNAIMIGVLYVVFGRVLGPLAALAAGLFDLERRSFGVRLPRPAARELTAIADRFNSLAGALEAARAENAALYQRLITTQDDERRHTARELHDEVGPSLFGLKANAGSIATAAASVPHAPARAAIEERARDILGIVEHLQAVNRSLLMRLRPMALGHVPLSELLADMIRDRARQHPQIFFPLAAGQLASSYGDSIDLTVYRCVQEGLTNAIRHAGPRSIRISVGESSTVPAPSLEVLIEDDGCGIESAAPPGFGLRSMQERVQALGGTCTVGPGRGGGTRLRVAIPLADRAERGG